MGIEKSKLSARFAMQNAEFIAELCERWSPVVEGVSATLNLIVAVVRRMERAGTIDLSLAGMQRLLRGHCGQSGQDSDSPAPEMTGRGPASSVAGDAGQGALERGLISPGLKRPPRRIAGLSRRQAATEATVSVHPWESSFLGMNWQSSGV